MAREIVANDLQILTVLDQQANQAEDHLGLDRAVAQPAHGEDDAEGRRAEEEDL